MWLKEMELDLPWGRAVIDGREWQIEAPDGRRKGELPVALVRHPAPQLVQMEDGSLATLVAAG